MKELFQRVYYFKVQSKQKGKQLPGIERTTLVSLDERSTLRATMHSALSMVLCVSATAIEHDPSAAAAATVEGRNFKPIVIVGHTTYSIPI